MTKNAAVGKITSKKGKPPCCIFLLHTFSAGRMILKTWPGIRGPGFYLCLYASLPCPAGSNPSPTHPQCCSATLHTARLDTEWESVAGRRSRKETPGDKIQGKSWRRRAWSADASYLNPVLIEDGQESLGRLTSPALRLPCCSGVFSRSDGLLPRGEESTTNEKRPLPHLPQNPQGRGCHAWTRPHSALQVGCLCLLVLSASTAGAEHSSHRIRRESPWGPRSQADQG